MYFFNAANGGVIESPPMTPPLLADSAQHIETYRAATEAPVVNAYPQSHRALPQIDTSSRVSSPGYWSASTASDDYSNASTYPSPTAYPSSCASAYPSPTVPYAAGPAQYPHPHPHPHTFRHASHSPAAAAVPVARSLTARHSLANISAHAQQQRAQQSRAVQLGNERTLHQPAAQIQLHQPIPQTPHYPPPSVQSTQTYPAPHQDAPVSYAPESYRQDAEPHPNTPSPPSSSHHSPQTPYTPFQEPGAVYAASQYPVHSGEMHPPAQYDDAMHATQVYGAHASHDERAYQEAYAAPAQEATYAPYDGRGQALNFAYGAVPAMQFLQEPAPEVYGKQHPHGYAAAQKPYSPLLLAALPSLRRESMSDGYVAARRDSEMLSPGTLSSLTGYGRRESEPRYAQPARPPESYTTYAPTVASTPYLHHPQPQTGEYLADYGWRVAVQ
ncbi:hypothetical protein B0H13DRAFT_447389 [Mycena leptocephala]|nr:hypothetical protein B0H13DRAFT_447389 [Mycena leptocephala]